MSNLKKMVELIKDLKLGQHIDYKGIDATITAFNDEGVFLKADEIKVLPDEFEGGAEAKSVKDKRVEELKREAWQLRNEIERLLNDRDYYEYRRRRESDYRYEQRRRMERSMESMRDMMSPQFTGIYGGGEFVMDSPLPRKEVWIDPLTYKAPSQKKGPGWT